MPHIPDLADIPEALRARPQWVLWKYETRDGDPKPTKMPYQAKNPFRKASSNAPHTWASAEEAIRVATKHKFDGIGFVFSPEDPFAGFDLDDCIRADGTFSDEAESWLEKFETYVEISPSGHGVKGVAIGKLPGDGINAKTVELYDQGRYFAITGRRLDGFPSEPKPVNGALDQLYTYAKFLKEKYEAEREKNRQRKYALGALRAECDRVAAAPEGTRNDTLNIAAFNLGQFVAEGHLTEREIKDALSAAAGEAGLRSSEIGATLRSGIDAGKSEAPRKIPDGKQQAATAKAGTASLDPWGAVVPFETTDLPVFPTDIFPPWLRNWVEAVAEATQTPVDLGGMLALSVLATCCQRWTAVEGKPGWIEPTNLYTITALPPASRKSAVFGMFNAPLVTYEQQRAAEAKRDIATAVSREDVLKDQLADAKRSAARANTHDESLAALEKVDRLSQQVADIVIPVVPRLIVDDVTPETLTTLISEQGGRMAALSPEGDLFAIMAGRYTSGGPNLGVFLKAHAGDTLRVDRRGRAEFVAYPTLTLGITTQPSVVRGLAEKAGFRGQGLLGRFLYALPDSLVGRRKIKTTPVPDVVKQAYYDNVFHLLETRATYSANSANSANIANESLIYDLTSISVIFALSANSIAMLDSYLGWLEPHLAQDGAFGPFADWAGKLGGAVLRIAGLLHIGSHNSHNSQIEESTLAAALRLAAYLIPHAAAAFSEMGSDPAVAGARRALRWLDEKRASVFTKRDLFEGIKGSVSKADDLDPILKVLTDHVYIRPVEEDAKAGPGRKPSQRYEVNPDFYSHNSQNSRKGLPTFQIPEVSNDDNDTF